MRNGTVCEMLADQSYFRGQATHFNQCRTRNQNKAIVSNATCQIIVVNFLEAFMTARHSSLAPEESAFFPEQLRLFYDLIPTIFQGYFNDGTSAPDDDIRTVAKLIDIVNCMPRNFRGTHLYSVNVRPNVHGAIKLFNSRTEVESFFHRYASGVGDTLFNPLEIPDITRKAISNIFKEIYPLLQICDPSIIQHIQPINTPERKMEALRVFVTICEFKNALEFLTKIRKLYFSLDGVGLFAIPFAINFGKRINGIVNSDGRLLFDPAWRIFLNGLEIQKLQRCKILQ